MNSKTFWTLGALSLAACSGGEDTSAPVASSDSGGDTWQVLFDGTSLDRWNVVGDADWTVEGGTVRADQSTGTSFLVSDVDYTDFDLSVEFWVDEPANSGIFLRCDNADMLTAETCYEVNIYDTRPDPTYRTGALVNFAAPAEEVNTAGRWNRYEISAHGDRIAATLNGNQMFDVEDSTHRSGPIGLQYGTGVVIFRNIRIRTP